MTRQLIAQRVVQGHWSYTETAEAFGLSAPTVRKWVARHRAEGLAGLEDRSSRPRRSPTITAPALVTAIQQLRTDHGVPAWLIGRALGVPRSTVSAWLRRLGLHRVRAVAAAVRRYEWPALGDMLHLDIKPLGRIGCVGHRIHGDRRRCARGVGWEYAHVAVDDYSRIAYVEVLPDQHGATCAAFLRRALAWWAHRGVTVQRLLTDNGSGYLSRVFRQTCEQLGVGHRRTRPYMPRTNGKAERFHPDPVARMGVRDGVSRFAHPPPGAPALAAVLQPGTAARESRVRHALVATQRRCLMNNVLDHNS